MYTVRGAAIRKIIFSNKIIIIITINWLRITNENIFNCFSKTRYLKLDQETQPLKGEYNINDSLTEEAKSWEWKMLRKSRNEVGLHSASLVRILK